MIAFSIGNSPRTILDSLVGASVVAQLSGRSFALSRPTVVYSYIYCSDLLLDSWFTQLSTVVEKGNDGEAITGTPVKEWSLVNNL